MSTAGPGMEGCYGVKDDVCTRVDRSISQVRNILQGYGSHVASVQSTEHSVQY